MPASPVARPGGPVGRGVALPRSVPLPSLGRQQSGCPWRRSGYAGRGLHSAPVRAHLLSPGTARVASLCAGAGLLVPRGSCGSRRLGAWRRALLPPPPPGVAVLLGEGGPSPLPWGGLGAGAPVARGLMGGSGGTGDRGVVPWFSTSLLRGGRPVAPCPDPPSAPAHPPQVYVFGQGREAAPGAGRGPPPAGQPPGGGGGGGTRGGLCAALPGGVAGGPSRAGGHSASVRPSAFPGGATNRVSSVTLRSWGVSPPYCSGLCSPAAPRCSPCVVLVRWRGFACLSRPPREQAVGGVGVRGVHAQLRPPPKRLGPFGGSADVPSASGGGGGLEGRHPRGPQAGGGSVGERGLGVAPWFLTPLPPGGGPWTPAQSPSFPGAPPLGIYVQLGLLGSPGRRARPARPSVGQPGGGGGGCQRAVPPGARLGDSAGQGAGRSLCRGLFPRLLGAGTKAGHLVCAPPSVLHFWVHLFRCGPQGALERRRRAAGRQWGLRHGRLTGGTRRAAALPSAVASPPLAAAALPGGVRGRRPPGRPPAVHGPRGGEGGGGDPRSPPLVPWLRLLAVAGAQPSGSRPGRPAADGEGALVPRPPPFFGCRTLVQALARALRSPRCRRPVPAGWGEVGGPASAGGGDLGQWLAVSWLRGSGPPPAPVALALSPTGGGAHPSAASSGGGGGGRALGRGARPCWGGRPAALSPTQPLALIARAGGARPSPASSLTWGPGLRQRRVPPAVAPVAEGGAQGPVEPVVGIRIQESRPRGLPVGPRRPNQRPGDPLVVLWGRSAPPWAPPGPPRPSGGARHGGAGFSSPLWSPSRPSSATCTPPPPGGGPNPPGGLDPCPSPSPRAGPPLPPALAPPAASVPVAPAPRPAPPPPGQRPSVPPPPSARGGPAGAGVGRVWGG